MVARLHIRRFLPIFASLVLLGVAGCFLPRSSSNPMEGPQRMLVRVQNNLQPPKAISVYIHPAQGGRTLLGSVSPSSTDTFEYEPEGVSSAYRLTARTSAGRSLVSNQFEMTGRDGAEWSLWENHVTLYRATRVAPSQADTSQLQR